MLEESLPAAWASMNSWFTPTLLFLLLNVVIGTIAIASGLSSSTHKQQQHDETDNQHQPQPYVLAPSPSLLQRLKSINLYRFKSDEFNPFPSITTAAIPPPEPHHITIESESESESESEPEKEAEEKEEEEYAHDESWEKNPYDILDHHVSRTKSDTNPASGVMPVSLPKKMKKSASSKSAFAHFQPEETTVQRPATVRESKKKVSDVQFGGDDEEVDAKADDFINRFKNQLKLQRLDSILRYKEMIGRGSATANKLD